MTYIINGVRYTREVFASAPDEVIVVRLSADRKGAIGFRASMDRPADFTVNARGQDTLVLREGPEHKDQIRFAGEALVIPPGGNIHAEASELVVAGADSATILIAAATDFKGGPFTGGDPEAKCEQALAKARTHSAAQILARQEAVYQPMYRRMELHLGAAPGANDNLPTDERMKRVSAGADDLGLQELYFQFARYLLIGSSRPDGLPANLQGIWAGGTSNPWGSKWTINVNTEMNYWLAEPAGLGETVLPLITSSTWSVRQQAAPERRLRRTTMARAALSFITTRTCGEMPNRSMDTSGASGPWAALGSLSTRGIITPTRSTKASCETAHGPFCTMPRSSSWIILLTMAQAIWSPARRSPLKTVIDLRTEPITR